MICLTQERLHEILVYFPENGLFVWKDRKDIWPAANARLKGTPAGSFSSSGYITIKIYGIKYPAHRVAYLYMMGNWLDYEIDHRDKVRDNNKWENLRLATHSQNGQNKGVSSRNRSGYKGVSWHKGARKWASFIRKDNKSIYLGLFESRDEAYEAYCSAAKMLFGEFAAL